MNENYFCLTYDYSAYSSVGRRRNNEDSYSVTEKTDELLAVVGDGLGGVSGGEIASSKLIESAKEHIEDTDLDADDLDDAIAEMNLDIFNLGKYGEGPKTTLALLWIKGAVAYAANVGDSRIYQLRGRDIVFQSTDHSVPQLAVQLGEIRPEDIRTHKDRNKITRCMGMEQFVSPDISKLEVEPGDRFILCSDGFWEPVLEYEMISTAADDPEACVWLERMKKIATAKEQDNHTAIVVVARENR